MAPLPQASAASRTDLATGPSGRSRRAARALVGRFGGAWTTPRRMHAHFEKQLAQREPRPAAGALRRAAAARRKLQQLRCRPAAPGKPQRQAAVEGEGGTAQRWLQHQGQPLQSHRTNSSKWGDQIPPGMNRHVSARPLQPPQHHATDRASCQASAELLPDAARRGFGLLRRRPAASRNRSCR